MRLSPSGSRRRRTALRLSVAALTRVGAGGIVALNFNAIEQKLAGQSVASYSVDYPADLSPNSAGEGNAQR